MIGISFFKINHSKSATITLNCFKLINGHLKYFAMKRTKKLEMCDFTRIDRIYQVSQKMYVYKLNYLLVNGNFFGHSVYLSYDFLIMALHCVVVC